MHAARARLATDDEKTENTKMHLNVSRLLLMALPLLSKRQQIYVRSTWLDLSTHSNAERERAEEGKRLFNVRGTYGHAVE